jgi:hypothetical protein
MKICKTAKRNHSSIEKTTLEISVKINKENGFNSCIKDKQNFKLAVKEKEKYKNDLQSSNDNSPATTMATEISNGHHGFTFFGSMLYHGSDYWMRSG